MQENVNVVEIKSQVNHYSLLSGEESKHEHKYLFSRFCKFKNMTQKQATIIETTKNKIIDGNSDDKQWRSSSDF